MKKIILFLIFVFCLTGCTSNTNTEQSLKLSKKQIKTYNEIINTELQSHYWNYNENSNTFERGYVESDQSPNYDMIINACESVGLDIKKYSGNEVVIATTELQHFNNDDAGKAYFYFIGSRLIGKYYIFNGKVYSVNDKNIFLKDISFNNLENTELTAEFNPLDIKVNFDDYRDIDDDGNFAVIDDDYKLSIYKLSNKNFRLIKNISYLNEGLYPMDICFNDKGAVVLLGKNDESITSNANQSVEYEDGHESDDENDYFLKSWKIEFLDKNFKKRRESIDLDLSTYTSVNVVDGKLLLSRGNSIDIFEEQDDSSWIKSTQIMLKNNIEHLRFTDIDGNGKLEAVAIDGMDLYVFEFNETFELIWKTNLSINSMKNSLYVEDLNGDGVKEIYIEDLSDTTARYILENKGFKSYSNGIEYLHKLIVGDFNCDGKADYIESITLEDEDDTEATESKATLYLAK